MKRLFNEYGASPGDDAAKIDVIICRAVAEMWSMVVRDDLCPRDIELIATMAIRNHFAERVLMRACSMRKSERGE